MAGSRCLTLQMVVVVRSGLASKNEGSPPSPPTTANGWEGKLKEQENTSNGNVGWQPTKKSTMTECSELGGGVCEGGGVDIRSTEYGSMEGGSCAREGATCVRE